MSKIYIEEKFQIAYARRAKERVVVKERTRSTGDGGISGVKSGNGTRANKSRIGRKFGREKGDDQDESYRRKHSQEGKHRRCTRYMFNARRNS